jgi:hypothetical protein
MHGSRLRPRLHGRELHDGRGLRLHVGRKGPHDGRGQRPHVRRGQRLRLPVGSWPDARSRTGPTGTGCRAREQA